ncbi:MAG: hypothetical protein GX640_09435 [Fibrobacter sp.]|nr:hypothetical protein [Fibrobacter sp.]
MFEIQFDLTDHQLIIQTSNGKKNSIQLQSYTVSEFYEETMRTLQNLGINIKIWPVPVETEDTTPFNQDRIHRSYDKIQAHNFWRILVNSEKVMQQFRSRFIGKCSPIHFFWGGFDLAVTRFSGRKAPLHPSMPNLADFVTQEAYSHEVSSCGFWPGGGIIREPVYYSYAYPEPPGFKNMPVFPKSAFYSEDLHEFLLPYNSVHTSANPEKELLSFFHSTYNAAAETAHWDRTNLERKPIPKIDP